MANNGQVYWLFWRNGEPAERRVHLQENYLLGGSGISLAELRAAPGSVPQAEEDGGRVRESAADAQSLQSNIRVERRKF